MIRTLLDSRHPFIDGITLEQLDREHSVRLKHRRQPFPAVREGGFGTPSGKCEFHAETLGYRTARRIAPGETPPSARSSPSK